MDNIINISEILILRRSIDEYEDDVAHSFLESIDEYSNLLLNDKFCSNKLVLALHLLEKLKPIFLNGILFKKMSEMTNEETSMYFTLKKLINTTNEYFDLVLLNLSKRQIEVEIYKYKLLIYDDLINYLSFSKKQTVKEISRYVNSNGVL